jgi:hypothetical protein
MAEAGADAVRVVPVDAETLRKAYGFVTPTPTKGMFAVVGAWGGPGASPFVLLNGHRSRRAGLDDGSSGAEGR